jgi:hypothetical protein
MEVVSHLGWAAPSEYYTNNHLKEERSKAFDQNNKNAFFRARTERYVDGPAER